MSFRGKDLSGADFSEADIRGTNFRDATLRGTKFIAAKAGLQKRWVVVLLVVCLGLVVFSGFFCALAGYLVADLLLNDTYGIDSRIAGWASILSLLGLCLFIIRQGLNSAIAIAFAFAIAIAIAFAFAFASAFA
ncbi:MAG: pentapeptide repeat-containing protein, partial [Cyanobacteriota bacterium]|nr:pentapeptide repeat-containing protein [Cyanobacteriota bacterium]